MVLVEETIAGDTPGLGTLQDGSVHVKIKRSGHWLARENCQVGLCLMTTVGRRAGGGGGFAPFRCCRGLLPVDVTDAPTLYVEGPRSVPSRISVVLVDGTMAGDTPGRECPREDRDWRLQAGVTRPAGVSVFGGGTGSPCSGGTLPSLVVARRLLPVVPAGGPPQLVLPTLLAHMAQLLQVTPLAHVGRCLHFYTKFWDR